MRRGDHGASIIEWGATLMFVSGIAVALLSTADVAYKVQNGIRSAICRIFEGSGCELQSSPTPTARPAGGGNDAGGNGVEDNGTARSPAAGAAGPLARLGGGALDRLGSSLRSAGCMLHLCGGDRFGSGWNNAAAAAASPMSPNKRLRCRDWARPEGARPTRPDGSPRQRTTVGHFNMFGNKKHGGSPDAVVPAIERSVKGRSPTFLSLNEGCETQFRELDRRLDGYKVHFVPVQAYDKNGKIGQVTCKNKARFGNAVLYREDFAGDIKPTQYSLGTPKYEQDGNEIRSAACVGSASKGTTFCSAHLTEADENARATETRNLRDNLTRDFPKNTLMMGGDFNGKPDSKALNNLYDPRYGGGANGRFKEVDSIDQGIGSCRGGESTQGRDGVWGSASGGRKIDYIFTTPDVEIHNADSTGSGVSDHDPIWSDVTF
jgi:endonuclease/exonuclease/phosphatase family metal-dependent hydrolase